MKGISIINRITFIPLNISRYIGGCCGFEPYHIRAISEELSKERGGRESEGSQKHDVWGGGLRMHTKPWVRARARKEYWANLNPSSGRPFRYVHRLRDFQ